MEILTREEIEMCEIAVGQLMDSRDLTPENMKKWEALWDKLERIQRETCLTQAAPDVAITCANCGEYHSIYLPCKGGKREAATQVI